MTSKKHNNYLIVISIDALNALDLDILKTLPVFSSFINEGSFIKEVTSVYPTLTYPCHTSISTGVYPDKHGIIANEKNQPERYSNQEWYWYKKNIKTATIFDYAKKMGYTVGTVLWPVMAGAPVNYNCPEIWGQNFLRLYFKNCTRNISGTILKYAWTLRGINQPNLDNFSCNIADYLITKKKPNLLFVHFTELDHERHLLGLKTKKTKEILRRMNNRLERLIYSAKKTGIYDNTTFIILGDHGTNDYDNFVYMNSLFKQEGLLKVNRYNKITYWKAYSNSCGGSAHIRINNKGDKLTIKKVENLLYDLSNQTDSFLEDYYTRDEVKRRYHLSGDFDYVLEAKDGYIFKNSISDTIIMPKENIPNAYVADHGFLPNHNHMKTLFFAKGRGIKRNVCIEKAYLVDEAPTMARLLGIKMKNIDGKCLEQILE